VTKTFPQDVAAFVLNEVRLEDGVSPDMVAALVHLKREGVINHDMMVASYRELAGRPGKPVVPRDADRGEVAAWVAEARAAHPEAKVGYLIGQVRKLSGGRADPRLVREMLGCAT